MSFANTWPRAALRAVSLTAPILLLACAEPVATAPEPAPLAEEEPAPAKIAPEALRLIAEGDAAEERARSARAEAAAIRLRLSVGSNDDPLGWTGRQTRGTTPATSATSPLSDAERGALAERFAELEGAAEAYEAEAQDYWERAIAIDAGAMEAILTRMRGESPGS